MDLFKRKFNKSGHKDQGSSNKKEQAAKGSETKKPQNVEKKEQRVPKTETKSTQKSAKRPTNSQSALRSGNETGLRTKKGNDSFIQFGPILTEFLNSKELVNKNLVIRYNQLDNKMLIDFSFSTIQLNGVTINKPVTLNLDDYMAQRNQILKKADAKSLFADFATRLLERLGVDVTQAKPSVDVRSVRDFITKHLSPVERVIVNLDKDDYDQLDTDKIPNLLKPTMIVVDKIYGGLGERSEYLVTQINSTTPATDIVPPNWVQHGVIGMSKGVLLENLKIQKVTQLNENQKQSLLLMKKALGIDQEEEEKTPEETVL